MSWLLNAMTNEISENFMFYDTAKDIWDAVKEMYSNVDNTSAVFEIKSIVHDLRQGESSSPLLLSILTYSTDIGSSWTYMKKFHGAVQKIRRSIRKWWKKIGFTSSYCD